MIKDLVIAAGFIVFAYLVVRFASAGYYRSKKNFEEWLDQRRGNTK